VDPCTRLWTPVDTKARQSGLCTRLWTRLGDLRIRRLGFESSGRAEHSSRPPGVHGLAKRTRSFNQTNAHASSTSPSVIASIDPWFPVFHRRNPV